MQNSMRNFATRATSIPPPRSNMPLVLGGLGLAGGVGLYYLCSTGKVNCLLNSFNNADVDKDNNENQNSVTKRSFFSMNDNFASLVERTAARVKTTYGYVLGGLGITAASAAVLFKTQLPHMIMRTNPWMVLGCSLAVMIPTLIGTMTIDYEKNPILKHTLWTGFNVAMAGSLCTLGFVGGVLIGQAALATVCIVGGLSFVAMNAKPGKLEQYESMLGIGLGVIVAASLGAMIFPMPLLYNISLYGGLAVFSGLTMTDTRKIIIKAETDEKYDPINCSLAIYLDTVNMFIRILQILENLKNK